MSEASAPDDLAAALNRLWVANLDRILARGAALVAALEDAAAGRPVDRVAAAREAHTLAGALGAYGKPGSALFEEVEQTLASASGELEPEADLGSCADRVRRALAELR